jgi:hypothetical protein
VLSVVEEGDPTITSIEPEEQLPNREILCRGTDLGPPGWCFLTWTDAEDNSVFSFGFANGYDRVHTWVPWDATAGAGYDVVIDFSDGSSTNAFPYEVGTPPPPEITELEHDMGPAGSLVGIVGENLIGGGYSWPVVEFTKDDVPTEAIVYFFHGGFGDKPEKILVEVPRDLEEGDYEVTVTVNGQASNAVTFTVGDLPLTFSSMRPDSQGEHGPRDVVVIRGTGFGVPDYPDFVIAGNGIGIPGGKDPSWENYFTVTVTWEQPGEEPLLGIVVWQDDREILVIPPGGWHDPLPVGEYTVVVTVDRGEGETESVEAGTYTVHEGGDGGGGGNGGTPFPGTR